MSRELALKMSVSIDGFVAGPNGELDWVFRSSSEESRAWLIDLLGQASLHAIGHRTYKDMANYWPTSPLPMAKPMNEIPKAVFSRNGKISPADLQSSIDPAVLESWRSPFVGGTDLAADIERLKQQDGMPILAHGGASFATSLIAAGLVDLFHLVVHPVALGSGLPIFSGLEKPLDLKLIDLKQFDTGVVVKTYRPQT